MYTEQKCCFLLSSRYNTCKKRSKQIIILYFLSNITISFKNTNNLTCKEREKRSLPFVQPPTERVTVTVQILCTLYTTTFDVRSSVCLCEKLLQFLQLLQLFRMSLALDKKFMTVHIISLGKIDVKEIDTCSRFDRYEHYLGYTCRTICDLKRGITMYKLLYIHTL